MKRNRFVPASKVLLERNIEVGKKYWIENDVDGFIIQVSGISEGCFKDQGGYGDSLWTLINHYNVHKVPQNTKLGVFEGTIRNIIR